MLSKIKLILFSSRMWMSKERKSCKRLSFRPTVKPFSVGRVLVVVCLRTQVPCVKNTNGYFSAWKQEIECGESGIIVSSCVVVKVVYVEGCELINFGQNEVWLLSIV